MTDISGRGMFGSLRKRVEYELREHMRQNKTMLRTRYSWPQRQLRRLLVGRTFQWFVGVYLVADLLFASIEAGIRALFPFLPLPTLSTRDLNSLHEIAGYLIAGQIGLLAIISAAVGIVTLVSQRDDSSATNADVRLYYSESLAYEVVSSGSALALVLCIQLIWPAQALLAHLGGDDFDIWSKALLTAGHIAWACINVSLFANFLTVTLRFVEPKARSRMRERFTSNVVVPADLAKRLRRHFYLVAPKQLSGTDDNSSPHIILGQTIYFADSETEVEVNFVRPSVLADVWIRPLHIVVKRWLKRSERYDDGKSKNLFGASRIWLAFVPSFERSFEGQTSLCTRQGGAKLGSFERWLVRQSFRFKKTPADDKDVPDPSALLEQLLDRVVSQIERLAQTGFRQSFEEATAYHRFLLDLHDTTDDNGKPLSLAQIGGMWQAPYEEWIFQYRRVIEAAANQIGVDDYFINRLGHTVLRLLPRKAETVAAPVVEKLLDLGVHQVVVLESWLTRHTSVQVTEQEGAQPRVSLAGSDRSAYEDVVIDFVGAWESALQSAGGIYDWPDGQKKAQRERWDSFRTSRGYLQQHLRNSAFFLASAIWNEDEIGAVRYRDMLVRWPDHLRSSREQGIYHIQNSGFVSPDILKLDWAEAVKRIDQFKQYPQPSISPETAFSVAIRNTHSDYLIIAAAVVLHWHAERDFDTPSFADASKSIIRREFLPNEGASNTIGWPQPDAYMSIWALIIRLATASRSSEGGSSAYIAGLVRLLSGMSERRFVSGRIYSGSGSDGFASLQNEILMMLGALLPDSDEKLLALINKLAQQPEMLGCNDSGLQDLIFAVRAYSNVLNAEGEQRDKLAKTMRCVNPQADPLVVFPRLATLLNNIVSAIDGARIARLKAAPLESDKIGSLRAKLEASIVSGSLQLSCFGDFGHSVSREPSNDIRDCTLTSIDKIDFVSPALSGKRDTDLFDVIADSFRGVLSQYVWRDFWARSKEPIQIGAESGSSTYWDAVLSEVTRVGDRPALLVAPNPTGNKVMEWEYGRQNERPAGRTVQYLQDRNGGQGAGYCGTIDGVDVYSTNMQAEESYLLSSSGLEQIVYHPIVKSGPLVTVEFVEGDNPRESKIIVRFAQETVWHPRPVIEFRAQAPVP